MLEYLKYEGWEAPEGKEEPEKNVYLIKGSKVKSILTGHVNLNHPVITFIEGAIPRNTYHNTLAFRLSIPLVREPNEKYKKWKEKVEKAKQEAAKKLEEEKKKKLLDE